MKKALIIFAIVAMASLTQAAAVAWKATAGKDAGGSVAYLVLTSKVPATIASIDDITGNATAHADMVAGSRNSSTGDQLLSLDPNVNAPGTKIGYTIFLVSGDSYYNAGSASATVFDDLAPPPASANSDGAVGSTSIPGPGSSWTVVPEPTTVALLALGLAALGLKRKVA